MGAGDKEKKAIRIKKGMLGNPSCKLHFIPVYFINVLMYSVFF